MRIRLYGLGRMGRHHERHLRALGCAVEIEDPALGLQAAGPCDAAVIAAPTSLHAAVALPLLRAGIPCLIEKPLAASLAEAEELASYPLMVGHIERFNPAFRLLPPGVRFLQAERLAPFTGRAGDVDVILDLMIHDIDLFLSLDPADPPIRVEADGLALPDRIGSGHTDIAQARLRTARGRAATLTASRVSRGAARSLRAFLPGEYWSLDLKDRRAHRVRWGASLHEEAIPVPEEDALRCELEAFLAGARGERPFPITGADGLAALRIAEQIRAQIAAQAGGPTGGQAALT